MDTNVSLDERYKDLFRYLTLVYLKYKKRSMTFFRFNEQIQQLVIKKPNELKLNHPLKSFITQKNTLDVDKLFHCFMYNLHKVLEDYEVPQECLLSRKHLKLVKKVVPCEKCVDLNTIPPRFVRCVCKNSENSATLATSKI